VGRTNSNRSHTPRAITLIGRIQPDRTGRSHGSDKLVGVGIRGSALIGAVAIESVSGFLWRRPGLLGRSAEAPTLSLDGLGDRPPRF